MNFTALYAEEKEEKPEFMIIELDDHEFEKLEKSTWEQFEKLKVNEQIIMTLEDTELAGLQPSVKGPIILRSTRSNRIVGMLAIGFSVNFCVEYAEGIPIKTYFRNNFGDRILDYSTFKECFHALRYNDENSLIEAKDNESKSIQQGREEP